MSDSQEKDNVRLHAYTPNIDTQIHHQAFNEQLKQVLKLSESDPEQFQIELDLLLIGVLKRLPMTPN